jgi:hypothetical protein
VPYADVAHLVRGARPTGGKTAAAGFSPEKAEGTARTC